MSAGTREMKVGLFVFIAFVLLAVMVFSISDFYTAQPHYALRVRFSFANGIQVGAPVRLVGVNVGEVRTVEVYTDEANQRTQAELGLLISREARIEEDAVAYINTLGLIGEKYLEIVPGTPGARTIEAGETLVGKDSIPTEKLVESGYRVVQELEQTVAAIHEVVGDKNAQMSLKGTFSNTAEASEKLNRFLEQANVLMAKINGGEGTVGRLLTQDDLYKDLQALTADIKAHPWKLFFHPKEKKK